MLKITKSTIKSIWSLAILLFLIWFFYDNSNRITAALKKTELSYAFYALISVFFAKFLLVKNMHLCSKILELNLDLKSCFTIYNKSQVYKYLPGNIWHFVNKASLLKRIGLTYNEIKNIILLENVFLFTSSLAIGTIFLLTSNLEKLLSLFTLYKETFLLLTILLLAFFSYALFKYKAKKILCTAWNIRRELLSSSLVLILIWTALGFSFYFIAINYIQDAPLAHIPLVLCSFAIAYSIGYITPFASAGIGVRESILTITLSSILNWQDVILISLLSRAITIFAEIILFVISNKSIAKPAGEHN